VALTTDFIVRNGLQAYTNAAVGSYAMTNAAPSYGMIISGNVGIGTATVSTTNVQVRGNTASRSYWSDAVLDLVSPTLVLDFINRPYMDPRFSFSRASNATIFNSTGTLTSVGYNQPRFDYDPTTLACNGLLMEESRTNSIPNSTMVGGATGTPGTIPTGWNITAANGLSYSIVNLGTESGIPFIDIRYSGTPTATGDQARALFYTAFTPATSGQFWTGSMYCSLVNGSTVNITNFLLEIASYDGSNVFNGNRTVSFTPITGTLVTQRVTNTYSTLPATTASVRMDLVIGYTINLPIDVTIRIGLPQLEQGAFVTSVIPTYGSTATRAVENCNLTVGTWYNQQAGTLYVETNRRGQGGGSSFSSALYTSSTSYIGLQYVSGSGTYTGQVYDANSSPAASVTPVNVSNVDFGTNMRTAVSFDAISNIMVVTNKGVSTTFGSSFPGVPTITSLTIGGRTINGDFAMTGNMRKLSYYPARLSNATVQSMTAIT
jgi:hypothetical protein